MTSKLNPIERALLAAASMPAPNSREILMMICQSGMTTEKTVEQPTPGQVHYSKREKIIKRAKSACDRIIDYAKYETLRNVEKHFRDTSVASAEGDEPKSLAVKLAFKKARFSEEMAAALREEATIALGIAGQQLFDEIGSDSVWKTPAADVLEYLTARENLFANASDEIHSDVMEQLQAGLDHGETKKELMSRIGATFDGIKQTRADTIANTETAAAFNFSRDKAMREAGVTHKKWLLSHSPLIKEHRATHVENTGQTVPIDEPFDISGVKFMYPSDDSLGAGPEDIINCHCVAIPVEAPIKGKTLMEVFASEGQGHPFRGNQYIGGQSEITWAQEREGKFNVFARNVHTKVEIDPQGNVRLRGVAVDTGKQGKGIGSTFVHGLLKEARSKFPKAKEVVVWAFPDAHGFWSRVGFKATGRIEQAGDSSVSEFRHSL